jgi:thiol-disulfide isomerase/thioredoxin
MKKYVWMAVAGATSLVSCSKGGDVYIDGVLAHANPLDRIELIEANGIATLPVANIGLQANGKVSDTIQIGKSGLYALVVGQKMGFVHLKAGQKFSFKADAATFPQSLEVTGDAQNNNQFLKVLDKNLQAYIQKFDQSFISKDEKVFFPKLQQVQKDLEGIVTKTGQDQKADSDIIELKKNEMTVNVLMLAAQYEQMHGAMTGKPNYKLPSNISQYLDKLEGNKDQLIKDLPNYRQFFFMKNAQELQKLTAGIKDPSKASQSELIIKFLDAKKELSTQTKDYVLAYVITQELNPGNDKRAQLEKIIDDKISDSSIKTDLKKLSQTMYGFAENSIAPDVKLIKKDGKAAQLSDYKNQPTAVMFYSSWSQMLQLSAPMFAQMADAYKGKANFLAINLDDTPAQFRKTAQAAFPSANITSLYAKGGMNSEVSKKFNLYSFKIPNIVVLDKDNKVASKNITSPMDPAFAQALTKTTKFTAPAPQMPAMPQMQAPAPVAAAPSK